MDEKENGGCFQPQDGRHFEWAHLFNDSPEGKREFERANPTLGSSADNNTNSQLPQFNVPGSIYQRDLVSTNINQLTGFIPIEKMKGTSDSIRLMKLEIEMQSLRNTLEKMQCQMEYMQKEMDEHMKYERRKLK